MIHSAHLGTVGFALALLLGPAVGGCSSRSDGAVDAQVRSLDGGALGDGEVGGDADGPQCGLDTDCVIVNPGPCGFCSPPRKDQVLALSQAERRARPAPGDAACAPCQTLLYNPLVPVLRAACVAQHCVVVDVREDELSRCNADADCEVRSAGCCPACGSDPAAHVGVNKGADAGLLECFPVPPCKPCTETGPSPEAYCAHDRHCAVRQPGTRDGVTSSTCFSASQNLNQAYTSGAVGCDCGPSGAELCIPDQTGRKVALICDERNHVTSAEDGPCGQL